jgi:hypothetical protein
MDDVVLTLDIDWAPDFAIDWIASRLVEAAVRATWFVTHRSAAVDRLRGYPELFELGVHPNFLPGSTHGATPGAVLRHCMALVPEASSLRSHALVQSSPLLAQITAETPITTDVSLFLPYAPALRPVEYRVGGRSLWRMPYFWEDDDEMEQARPNWSLSPLLGVGEGLKIFDFHPIHVYMNAVDMSPYRALADSGARLQDAVGGAVDGLVRAGDGTRTLFLELVEHLAAGPTRRICDIEARSRAAVPGA